MGYVTKLLRRTLLHSLTILTCNTDLLPTPQEGYSTRTATTEENNEGSSSSLLKKLTARTFSVDQDAPNNVYLIIYVSIIYDCLDLANVVIDLIFVVRLFYENISAYYATLVLVGLVLGRLVDYRGTTLLFRHGVDWNPFFITPSSDASSAKNQRVFSVLYCLVFTEAAVFLLEDYPSLVVYAHWMVLAFPPPILSLLDDVNVALSAASLAILLTIFMAAIFSSLFFLLRNEYKTWSPLLKLWNGLKIAGFLTGCAFLARYTIDMLTQAILFVNQDDREGVLPSNEIARIPVCGDVSFEDRREFCDERVFVLRVVIAWIIAGVFAAYLVLKPAHFETLQQPQDPAAGGSSSLDDMANSGNVSNRGASSSQGSHAQGPVSSEQQEIRSPPRSSILAAAAENHTRSQQGLNGSQPPERKNAQPSTEETAKTQGDGDVV